MVIVWNSKDTDGKELFYDGTDKTILDSVSKNNQ